mgnify:CR=1 FL=1
MVPPGPSLSPLDEANLRVRVQAVVDSVLAEQGAILTAIGDDLVPLLDALGGLLQGGKRLRPLITLAAAQHHRYAGRAHLKLAAAVEFIHTATLLHDDVVDESALRRGRPAARPSRWWR